MINWFLFCVKKNYLNFSGRASRSEFWSFYFAQFILYFIFIALTRFFAIAEITSLSTIFAMLYVLVFLLLFPPALSVSVRRLHDTGRSGLNLLVGLIPVVGFILLVFFCQAGNQGENMYGITPKNPS